MDFYDAWRINGNDALGPAAVSAMGMIRHPDSVKNLISYIEDEDPLIRINAISALGQIGDNSVLPHIAPALKDPDTEVRIAAIKAIIKFGGEEASELTAAPFFGGWVARSKARKYSRTEIR